MVLNDFDDIEIIAECTNGFEAIEAVQKYQPNVLFLDIQMPKLSGFDVLELLGEQAPPVVFVTAYDSYAVRAFEAHAFDYLLKPVQKKRLEKTLQRFRRQSTLYRADRQLLEELQKSERPLRRILIREGTKVHIIPVENISHVEAQGDYVRIYTEETSFLKLEKLRVLEVKLDKRRFVRVHRSYLLNLAYLRKIEVYSKDSRYALLQEGKKIPISRSGYQRLKIQL
ncbi:MAG TPA: response regulator [Calditrichaeota bacterium]|nr:response regulator [Calditrichota bacterium]